MNPKKISRNLGKEKRETQQIASRFCRVKKGNLKKINQDFSRTSFSASRPYSIHPSFKDKTSTYYESNQRKEHISRIKHQREMLNKNVCNDNSETIESLENEIYRCHEFIVYKQREIEVLKNRLKKRVEDYENFIEHVNSALPLVPIENKTLRKTLKTKIKNYSQILLEKMNIINIAQERLDNAIDHLRNLQYDLELEQEK